jgi:hypothetical protein
MGNLFLGVSKMEEKVSIADVASEGGKARAESLSPEERRSIARKAAEARWNSSVPKATHSGELHINDVAIPCAVLDDATRVLTQRGFSVALGRYKNPNKKGAIVDLPVFLSASNLSHFVDDSLARSAIPIKFRMAEGSGGFAGNVAFGYRAELLPQVCNVYLKAKHEGKLLKSQEHIADQCLILLNGLATVGVIALVDEATGYQDVRDRLALQAILDRYLRKEFAVWAKRFPDEFYQEIFRLRGWVWKGMKVNRPQCVAQYTKDLVYGRLAPGILKELETRNPITESGRRKAAMHQLFTDDIGHPALAQHLYATIGIMRLNDDGDWKTFMRMMNRSFPPREDLTNFPLFIHHDVVMPSATAPPPLS